MLAAAIMVALAAGCGTAPGTGHAAGAPPISSVASAGFETPPIDGAVEALPGFGIVALAAVRHPGAGRVDPPPAAARVSVQLGGPYRPAAGVRIVDRDRGSRPVPGAYSICYINAFQAQADEAGWWQAHHPDLLLRDRTGRLVIDAAWGEPLLDVSTPAKRTRLAAIESGWIRGCAKAGFQAVDPDNLDSYTRSGGRISASDAMAFARTLIAEAHRAGLAIAQKNTVELAPQGRAAGFDFAVAEDCQVYRECGGYLVAYGNRVIEIEYTDEPPAVFAAACTARGRTISVVLRDRALTPPGGPGHVERWCR